MPTATQQFTHKGLQEKRGRIRAELTKLGDKIKGDVRAFSPEEKAQFDQLKTDWEAAGTALKACESDIAAIDSLINSGDGGDPPPAADPAADGGANAARNRLNKERGLPPLGDGASADQNQRDRKLALQAWARNQHGVKITKRHKDAADRMGVNIRSPHLDFKLSPGIKTRSNNTATGAAGAYTIAREFSGVLEQALKDFSNVRGVVDQFTTATGASLDYPTEDDTNTEGAQISEEQETAFSDDTFGTVTFGGFKFSSKGVLISYELLNDPEFDMESLIASQIGQRIGRGQGRAFTTGTGTGQPHGIVTASTLGITTASAVAFTADELTRLAFAIDKAYRDDPSFGYMMSDTAVAYALLLKDGQNRPLLRDGYRDGITIPVLNGYPVYTNQFMDACSGVGGVPVTAKKHVLAGAFNRFKIRDIGPVRIRRLDERYAENDRVGFIGFMRSDSRCVNTACIKHMLQA